MNLIDSTKFTRGELSKSLLSGICEVHYINNDGNEENIACTLRKFHMDESKEKDWVDFDFSQNDIIVWSMRDIGWKIIPINKIVSYEQLTGVPRT